MKKIKNFVLTSVFGYISAVTTIVPIYFYYGFFFKESIVGQSIEILEGIVLLCFYYIPIVLVLSLIIQVIQSLIKRQLNNKVIIFIFIGAVTMLNLKADFNGINPSVMLIVTTLALYSIYYLLSSYVTNKKR